MVSYREIGSGNACNNGNIGNIWKGEYAS